MKVSVVISVYKDLEALSLILSALSRQTYQDFEIIVSEDGEDPKILQVIQQYNNTTIQLQHLTQPDDGWQKNKALNHSVFSSKSDYLIFIDGDCIPHKKFIATHMMLSEPKVVLTGRRCDIGGKFIDQLKTGGISVKNLESFFFYLYNAYPLIKTSRALEDAIYVNPHSILSKYILPKISKIRGILGCNFSCYKQDLLSINGFDEDYTEANFGEDSDLEWRFEKVGVKIKSVRNMAILYHLRHPLNKSHFEKMRAIYLEKLNQGQFFAKNGIQKSSHI